VVVSFGWLLVLPVWLVALGIEEYAHPPRFTLLGVVSGVNWDGPFDPHTWGSAGMLFLVTGVTTEMQYNHDKEVYACLGTVKDYLVKTTGWNTGAANGDGNHDLDGHCPDPSVSNRTQPFVGNTEHQTASEDQVAAAVA
jgi:hypothetical protein